MVATEGSGSPTPSVRSRILVHGRVGDEPRRTVRSDLIGRKHYRWTDLQGICETLGGEPYGRVRADRVDRFRGSRKVWVEVVVRGTFLSERTVRGRFAFVLGLGERRRK